MIRIVKMEQAVFVNDNMTRLLLLIPIIDIHDSVCWRRGSSTWSRIRRQCLLPGIHEYAPGNEGEHRLSTPTNILKSAIDPRFGLRKGALTRRAKRGRVTEG